MATKLNLRIHRVKCIDETGGAWREGIGNDEIVLGGFSIAQNGDTTKIPTISIYPHFDSGDVKTFNPPKVFHTFNLGNSFPKEFGVGLVLIEKDNGGSDSAIVKIAERAKELISQNLPAAGGVLGIVLGIVLSPLVNWVSNKIIGGIEDDLFPPHLVSVKIPGANFTWAGAMDSAEKTIRFNGHGGTYDLTYDWQLV